MREDMARVIVGRPRLGGGRARKGRTPCVDDLPKQEGLRRRYVLGGDPKTLNENLSPLRRYIERQVGRPWDKIYSEIAQHLRADNTVQQHVRDHLSDFVAIKPRGRTAGVYALDRTRQAQGLLWFEPFYVDPRDGLLKRTDRLREAKAFRRAPQASQSPPERIALAADRELRRINGLWFEVTLAPLAAPEYRVFREVRKLPLKRYDSKSPVIEIEVVVRRLASPGAFDVVSGAPAPLGPEVDDERAWAEYRRAYPDRRHAIAKRALSRAELRRHSLNNLAE